MNALQDRRPLMGLRLSPFVPMGKLVERLRTAFQEARTIRIEGFPVRVFVFLTLKMFGCCSVILALPIPNCKQ
jgi:hypothetical protein